MSPLSLNTNLDDTHRYHRLRSSQTSELGPNSNTTRRNSILPGTFELLGGGCLEHRRPSITDRAQLIQKIKAGEAPNWGSNRNDLHIHFFADRPFQEDIDRPKSALHSGIFTDDSNGKGLIHPPTPINSNFETSFQNAFHSGPQANPSAFGHSLQSGCVPASDVSPSTFSPHRLRAGSISSISNFVFKVPTSPLVYSSNTEHMDTGSTSPRSSVQPWIDTDIRTPTLPSSLSSIPVSPSNQSISHSRHYSLSYKRRSVPEAFTDSATNKPTRRLSSGLGLSELPFGSFVGSYEESILNGRMSTTPSKPLNFVAKIGVLGMGKCKPALRCPTHVTIPFPAYFYSVGDYDSPSPYVGQIDLEVLAETSNKKFPYGGYRIPQQGQLQIVIKNPNKTAVKLFLVPYDLRDMDVGTKTFVRQKSFATGNALLEEVLPIQEQRKIRNRERESLRYLIHLHICCPSRGRYYLYRNIRVVFANRVPDGKEKLRNEILSPNPRYSIWKPGKESTSLCSSISSVGRKRSQSLHGTIGVEHNGKSQIRGFPVEDPKERPPPLPALPTQYLNWSNSGTVALSKLDVTVPAPLEIPKREAGPYDKIPASLYSPNAKSEGHGLLARKLRGLDVEEQE